MRRIDSKRSRSTVALLLSVSLFVPVVTAKKPVTAIQAETDIPEELLLDVGIQILDPGLPEGDKDALEDLGIFADLRESEARFIPYHLKSTLEQTGNWGAVRVIPGEVTAGDVVVSGEILRSHGKALELRLRIVDSTGRVWRGKKYKQQADPMAYDDDKVEAFDPFQDLYDRIANDMLKDRSSLDQEEILDLREMTWLRFAADLVPSVYSEYIDVDKKGRYEIERLPALDDPMRPRLAGVRDRDYVFVDTLNEYYDDFHARMGGSYSKWRALSYEETVMLQEIRREAVLGQVFGVILMAGAVFGGGDGSSAGNVARGTAGVAGGVLFQEGRKKAKEAKIHREAIKEAAASFDAEIAPVLVEVDGQTLRLEGSAESQFAEWRRLLAQIFVAETGLPLDAADAGSDGPSRADATEN